MDSQPRAPQQRLDAACIFLLVLVLFCVIMLLDVIGCYWHVWDVVGIPGLYLVTATVDAPATAGC